MSPKGFVLGAYKHARCYKRGYDRKRRCYWWQVWNTLEDGGELLGMGKSALHAWIAAANRLHGSSGDKQP